ncbi:hypothetical protein F503_05664 [Ophiostoma piceae UAMH 11346]|uniref:Uncharacterized protein n=1 Tax=Ophiostoma piceae (strain UAMH 11346) TaxID=1262450 RepID=S3CAL1_OPHP1|nr:hypothetical protein F503_05664 [Ophiostoma piceae UAMH 11346]
MSATQAVQPMDSAADGRPPSASRTNIPSMRRERRQTQDAATRTIRESKSRERLQQMQERTSSMSSATSKRGYKGGEVRWDPRTGELTSSQKGRPSQVKPIEFVRGLATDIIPASPTESVHKDPAMVVPAPYDSTDPAAGAFTSNRPAWNGASGRTALVAPVHDTPDVAPLNIPRRSSKRVGSVPQLQKAMNAAKAAANAANLPSPSQNSGSLVSPPVSPSPQGVETQSQQANPLEATAALGQISAQTSSTHATKKSLASPTPASPAHSYPSPPLQDQQYSSQIRRKPTPSHQNLASFDASDPFNYNNRSNPTVAASPPELRPPLNEPTEWTQPTSRFSVTTYNSTIHESANEFNPNDVPDMPPIPDPLRSSPPFMIKRRPTGQFDDSSVSELRTSPPRQKPAPIITKPLPSLTDGDSVMDRRRPPRLGHSPKTPGNEPVMISLNTPWMSGEHTPMRDKAEARDYMSSGSGDSDAGNMSLYEQLRNKNLLGASGNRGVDNSDRASIAGSIHKNLPPAPPETSAKDRVAMLNAKLSGLAQRRINIGRSIKQMTELMPTDNLLATPDVLSKREREKRKVEGLRTDLAEIQREEYETGLKLHRAYKRLDKNAEYEPTTLWVRRVTG